MNKRKRVGQQAEAATAGTEAQLTFLERKTDNWRDRRAASAANLSCGERKKESEHRIGGEGWGGGVSVVSRRSIITKTTALSLRQPRAVTLFAKQARSPLTLALFVVQFCPRALLLLSLLTAPFVCAPQINNKRSRDKPSRAEPSRTKAELSCAESVSWVVREWERHVWVFVCFCFWHTSQQSAT